MNELTHLSLFTGFGGLDIAAEMAGFKTIGQCEWADYPTELLEKRFPGVARWRDIHTLTRESFYEKTGRKTVTVLSGGPPCQPFSHAGQRRGKADSRYLIPEYFRVLDEINPAWAIFENVTGLATMAEPIEEFRVESRTVNRCAEDDFLYSVLSRQEKLLYESILQAFKESGYDVQPYRIPACGVGANHQRYRIIIVAHSAGRTMRNDSQDQRQAIGEIDKIANAGLFKVQDVANTEGKRRGEARDDIKQQEARTSGRSVVANAVCNGSAAGITAAADGEKGKTTEFEYCREIMAYAESLRLQRELETRQQECRTRFEKEESERCSDVSDAEIKLRDWRMQTRGRFARLTNGDWWSTEPNLGRVANGVPHRVERLRGLGNAVVPAQTYPFFKTIADIERMLYAV